MWMWKLIFIGRKIMWKFKVFIPTEKPNTSYNEETDSIGCRFLFLTNSSAEINDDHSNVEIKNCSESPLGNPVGSLTIGGEKIYVVDLNKMCSKDSDGTGESCADRWDENVSSITVGRLGEDIDTSNFDLLPWESSSAGRERERDRSATIEDIVAKEHALGLAKKVSNLYNMALGIGAMLALGIIIYAGVRYTASGGNASAIGEAKKWISAALLGLVLLFGSYLLLKTINPDLLTLKDPTTLQNESQETEPPDLTLPVFIERYRCIDECTDGGKPIEECAWYPPCGTTTGGGSGGSGIERF